MANNMSNRAIRVTRKMPKIPSCRALFLLLLILICVHGEARGEVQGADMGAEHKHVAAAASAEETAVGIDERLGTVIPLDATFRDEGGKPVRLAELINGPTLILPVYYSCTNVCYNLQWQLAQVLPKIKRRAGEEYRIISVSFDENDSPQLAAKFKRVYLTAMHAPFPEAGWRFLTGDAENIHRLTKAVGYNFQRRGVDFQHPVASIMVAGDGTIVRYLYGASFLPKDLTLALVEAREGKSGAAVRKVLEYCFSFDPQEKSYVFNLLKVSATAVILCAGGFLVFLILTGRKRRGREKK